MTAGYIRELTIVPRITADEAGLRLESSDKIPPAAPRTPTGHPEHLGGLPIPSISGACRASSGTRR